MLKAIRLAIPSDISAAADSHPLISIALFCGIGLLLSLTTIIADQYVPGEWF